MTPCRHHLRYSVLQLFLCALLGSVGAAARAVEIVSLDPDGVDFSIVWRAGTGPISNSGDILNGDRVVEVDVKETVGAAGAVSFEHAPSFGSIGASAHGFAFSGTLATFGEARVSVGRAKFEIAPGAGDVLGTPTTVWLHVQIVTPAQHTPADVNARYSVNGMPYVQVGAGAHPLELLVGDEVRLLLGAIAYTRIGGDNGPIGSDARVELGVSPTPFGYPVSMPIAPVPEAGTLVYALLGAAALLTRLRGRPDAFDEGRPSRSLPKSLRSG